MWRTTAPPCRPVATVTSTVLSSLTTTHPPDGSCLRRCPRIVACVCRSGNSFRSPKNLILNSKKSPGSTQEVSESENRPATRGTAHSEVQGDGACGQQKVKGGHGSIRASIIT